MTSKEAHDAVEVSKMEQSNRGNQNNIPAWLVIFEMQLNKAKTEWYTGGDDAIKKIANLGGCVLTCLEQCGQGEGREKRGSGPLRGDQDL